MAEIEIKARENGPYLIPGSATYLDADGQEQTTTGSMCALCRCGGSSTKPFCDGTHRKIEFKAPEIVLRATSEELRQKASESGRIIKDASHLKIGYNVPSQEKTGGWQIKCSKVDESSKAMGRRGSHSSCVGAG
jgi:CDGSH-type Zn-finger protein